MTADLSKAVGGQLVFGIHRTGQLPGGAIATTADELPPPARPRLGIQLAPAAVGCSACLSITCGPPLFAQGLIGYAPLQASLLIRLMPLDHPATLHALTSGLSPLVRRTAAISVFRFRWKEALRGRESPLWFGCSTPMPFVLVAA